ncbi:hypothetical protein PATA110615_05130 [Paenibacillus taichungensis]
MLETHYYFRFKKMLRHPFSAYENKEPNSIEALYMAYKKLPKMQFKMAKLKVQSWNNSEIVPQSIDGFMKIIFTIVLTATGVVITIMISSLDIANSNKESDPNQANAWYDSISSILVSLTSSINFYQTLMKVALLLFLLSVLHIIFTYWKNSLHKKHIVVIEEIEKEFSLNHKMK